MKRKFVAKDLTPEKLAILYYKEDKSLAEIAREYGVSRQYIHQLYKHYQTISPTLFPNKDTEETLLAEKIRKICNKYYSKTQLCQIFNITLYKLEQILEKYGIVFNSISDILTHETLYYWFVVRGQSDSQIARKFNCSRSTVAKYRKIHNITFQDREDYKNRYLKKSYLRG